MSNFFKSSLTYFVFHLFVTVSSLALKVHARMIGNMTPFCTKEAFVNIVDTLLRLYKDKTRANLIPIQGSEEVSFKKKSHSTILHIYKLLVSTMQILILFKWLVPNNIINILIPGFSMSRLATILDPLSRILRHGDGQFYDGLGLVLRASPTTRSQKFANKLDRCITGNNYNQLTNAQAF